MIKGKRKRRVWEKKEGRRKEKGLPP